MSLQIENVEQESVQTGAYQGFCPPVSSKQVDFLAFLFQCNCNCHNK